MMDTLHNDDPTVQRITIQGQSYLTRVRCDGPHQLNVREIKIGEKWLEEQVARRLLAAQSPDLSNALSALLSGTMEGFQLSRVDAVDVMRVMLSTVPVSPSQPPPGEHKG